MGDPAGSAGRLAAPAFFWRGTGGSSGQALRALAAVGGEKGEQFVHRAVVGNVENKPALLPALDQPDPAQVIQVKRERRRINLQLFTNQSRIDSGGTRLDQQAKNGKPRFMPQYDGAFRSCCDFHSSSILKMR